jgi:predicted metal-dependent enzyme (double-stranded beta helix superfamily)
MNKPKVIKDYAKMDLAIREQVKHSFPDGFQDYLIHFRNAKGLTVSALPFETAEKYYLIRMTVAQALSIYDDDEAFDREGKLMQAEADNYQGQVGEFY